MRRDIAELLIKELTSGYYSQGKEVLHSVDDFFCVLGVLADLSTNHIDEITVEESEESYSYDSHKRMLPPSIVEWAELKNPHGFSTSLNKSLTQLNDEGKTFIELADIIKANWENL